MAILVTGFGPFGEIKENPSSALAESSGLPFQLLEVSFRAVDEWLEKLRQAPPERLLMIGVAVGSPRMRIELVARNIVGPRPDVFGDAYGPLSVAPGGPSQLGGTLWRGEALLSESETWHPSVDAGNYLCNYVYFRALQVLPRTECGFLHVPASDAMPLPVQREALNQILGHLAVGG